MAFRLSTEFVARDIFRLVSTVRPNVGAESRMVFYLIYEQMYFFVFLTCMVDLFPFSLYLSNAVIDRYISYLSCFLLAIISKGYAL